MVGGVLLVVTYSRMKRTGMYKNVGNNVQGRIVWGRNVRGCNVQGHIIPVPLEQ
jgi:hypothetical protein